MAVNQSPGTRYRVYITPRVSQYGYGAEVEVTDHITIDGLNTIKRAIDSQDYEVGVYFYSDVEVKGSNDNGYFNENDTRSIFPYYRDKAKVRIVFENTSGDYIDYYGLINEEATRIDALNETITFRALSRDSVIRNTQVAAGTVINGMSAKTALFNILSNPAITSVLTVNAANISPSSNFTIDIGSTFDGQPSQDAINNLLLCSNSIMKIDSSGNVFILSRAATKSTPILKLYGPYDLQRRQNLINIQNYNTGLQRMFTSVMITDANSIDTVVDDVQFSTTYGYRQTQFQAAFLLEVNGTVQTVANAMLAEFKVPKIELEVEVPTSIAQGVDLLDRVSIDWPLRITPFTQGGLMPVIGTATIGNTNLPLPSKSGSMSIEPNVAFKVIEIDENPQEFTSTLKLRQIGTTLSDGFFNDPASSIVGFAVIGVAQIGGVGDTTAQYNPSVVGAAQVGATKIA